MWAGVRTENKKERVKVGNTIQKTIPASHLLSLKHSPGWKSASTTLGNAKLHWYKLQLFVYFMMHLCQWLSAPSE